MPCVKEGCERRSDIHLSWTPLVLVIATCAPSLKSLKLHCPTPEGLHCSTKNVQKTMGLSLSPALSLSLAQALRVTARASRAMEGPIPLISPGETIPPPVRMFVRHTHFVRSPHGVGGDEKSITRDQATGVGLPAYQSHRRLQPAIPVQSGGVPRTAPSWPLNSVAHYATSSQTMAMQRDAHFVWITSTHTPGACSQVVALGRKRLYHPWQTMGWHAHRMR